MKVAEKLEAFSKLAMQSAEAHNDAARAEIDAAFADACQAAEASAQENARLLVKEAYAEAEQRKNNEVLNASTETRRNLIALRTELTETLFADVSQKLLEYTETEAYTAALHEELAALLAQYPEGLTVSLCARDVQIAVGFANAAIVAEQGADGMLGGFIARVRNKLIVIDRSFARRLSDAREAFDGFKITD